MDGPVTVRPEIAELRNLCLARMDATAVASLHPDRLLIEVERLIGDLATEKRVQLNAREQRNLATELVDDMLGLGPLEPLLLDESINDIMVNGPNHTFVERGGKLTQVPVRFRDWTHLTNICQRIAASVGRRVDESSPMCDARLKDGSRVNIILPPLAIDGPSISIRKFSKKPIDFERLIGYGTLTPPIARVLEIAARCRLNIIVSGGTGSGKTTHDECDLALDRRVRTYRHRRRRSRTAAAAATCRAPGNPSAQPGGQGRDHGSATLCATRCVCAPTASSSARCAAPRPSTCCRP